jgi:rhodanese-related sulfurtransferase
MGIEEFRKGLEAGKLVAIDVRTSDAFVAGHIPGSRLVPLSDVAAHAEELRALKKPIVAYCA